MSATTTPVVVAFEATQNPAVQSSSSNGAEGLVDLRRLGDLKLPADLNNPNDPRVFVVDPRSPEAWKTQVQLPGLWELDSHCQY